jgi:hypothetical protein
MLSTYDKGVKDRDRDEISILILSASIKLNAIIYSTICGLSEEIKYAWYSFLLFSER